MLLYNVETKLISWYLSGSTQRWEILFSLKKYDSPLGLFIIYLRAERSIKALELLEKAQSDKRKNRVK